ncbi:FxDxF family PEP-CTERM protein [Sphingomonas sp. KRR8]|uniref:FxDxF family PEP-CTERM protein n=1 Tax=Sphingomonas sp. KRR8 TaxID=2942996 RepID=UPI002020644A|nr:FxDxF family PEP-CTERM protein [Sphingomonas sp. KRR8]URD60966.1 FxDxF family PEP-CTERM protein [Sphingomonas sp. KRR8]
MPNLTRFAAAMALLTGAAGAANAAVITAQIDGASGSFSNPSVQCSPTVNSCPSGQSFTDTVTFTTPTGTNSVSAILNSTFNTSNPLTNLNFTSVVLNNGTSNFSFNIANGVFDSASRELIPLVASASNVLTINGTTFGDASYSGTLSFGMNSAVPEPATWALMLLGFGAVGFSMRRRNSAAALLQMA